MIGDERSRFCAQCEKRVYNFSKMQPEEITTLIAEKEGKVCARFYQRADGTMLLENCPVGVESIHRRAKVLVFAVFAIFTTTLLANMKSDSRRIATTQVAQLWDDVVWKVKGWFGIQRPVLVGEICVPAPKAWPSSPPKS